ncbi:two-component response regulator-like PRR95 isoform X1 [Zingiber officinale]|uniref:two-component response regulator-like PRR95 isoform X1 n=1 Tax=Zingiber officinale TaxID=94328 RepID=UPI001C4C9F48|nr:two-component response regulator-like PRR95 isoform X1 [Zingiber officinale]
MGSGEKRRKVAEAHAVVESRDWEEEEERKEEKGLDEVRWEKFFPRMPVRVLLVEGDDSTRQIIAALLRKCSYIVATASDGLKAWDTLQEKPQNIDLVLTEVDLPSISGFGLLTMIMDHDPCKNIPVIMMSSHDCMGIVFKCMLKGAADFLIKPIRKNELRNLWQHVWRRQIVNGAGEIHEIQNNCEVKHNQKSHYGKMEDSVECVAIRQANAECSEQGSDAHSSCTRYDMEAQSEHKKIELKLPIAPGATMDQSGQAIQMRNVFNNESSAKVNTTVEMEVIQKGRLDCNNIDNETYGQKLHQDRTSKDDVELVRDCTWKSNFVPQLELFLTQNKGPFSEKQECDKSSAWNHSSLSAFSLRVCCRYNSKTVIPTMLQQKSLGYESSRLKPVDPSKIQGIRINVEEINSAFGGSKVQDGRAVQCTPIQVTPFSLPIGDGSLGFECTSTVMQQMSHPQSGQSFWDPTTASIWQEAAKQPHSSHRPDQENLDVADGRSSSYSSAEKDDKTTALDERRHVTAAAGESGGSSNCNSSNLSGTNVFWPMAMTGNDEGKIASDGTKPADCHGLTQRELALNKFRLKRKERCFEKKVRYQSRKLLAEQRPRVKGQFVRQEKLNPRPALAGAFS